MSSQTIALIAILLSSLFWSTANVVTKILLRDFDPFPLAFLRFAIASFILIPLALHSNKLPIRAILKDMVPITLFSTGNIFFYYLGIGLTSANAAAIIYTIVPILSALFARYFIKEPFSVLKISGIIVGLIGEGIILVLPIIQKGEPISGDTRGNILILIASVSWAIYTVGSRRLLTARQYSPLLISTVSVAITAIAFGALTAMTPHRNFIAPLFSLTVLLLVLHLALFVTVATYILFQWAIKHSSAATASLNNYVTPVFAIALGVVFLNEQLTWGFILGTLFVILGVFLATGVQLLNQLKKIAARLFR